MNNFSNSNFGDFNFEENPHYESNNLNNFDNCSFSVFGYTDKEQYIDCVIFEYIYITEKSLEETKEILELFEYGWNKGIAPLELANIIMSKTRK